jgi:hypothetical protein
MLPAHNKALREMLEIDSAKTPVPPMIEALVEKIEQRRSKLGRLHEMDFNILAAVVVLADAMGVADLGAAPKPTKATKAPKADEGEEAEYAGDGTEIDWNEVDEGTRVIATYYRQQRKGIFLAKCGGSDTGKLRINLDDDDADYREITEKNVVLDVSGE